MNASTIRRVSGWSAGLLLSLAAIGSQALTTLPLETENDVLFYGATDFAYAGNAMTTGDFNKDGVADLAIGSYMADSPRGVTNVGAVSIYFGGSGFKALSEVMLPDSATEATTFYGTLSDERVGVHVAAGDLNGDGYADLVTVAQKSATGNYGNTKVHIIYGRPTFAKSMTAPDATLQRTTMYVSSLAIGDLNGDGLADLVIADNYTSGGVFIIFGSATKLSGTLDLTTRADVTISRGSNPDFFLAGGAVNQEQGTAIGDVNGDGIRDLAIGVPLEDIPGLGLTLVGKVYVLYGSRAWPAALDIETAANVVIQGAVNKDQAGGSLAIGKINGDNYADIVIGAPLSGLGVVSTTGVGRVFVVYGGPALASNLDLFSDANVTLKLSGGRIGFKTGHRVLATDLNGDGIGDITITSPGAFNTSSPNGWIHVVYGKAGLAAQYDLDVNGDLAIPAPDPVNLLAGGRFGTSVAIADLDGDGNKDLVGGAHEGAISGIADGYVAVLYSPSKLPKPSVYNPATRLLDIPELNAGSVSYKVQMKLADPASLTFQLLTADQVTPSIANPASINTQTLLVTLPEVTVGTVKYTQVKLAKVPGPAWLFRVSP